MKIKNFRWWIAILIAMATAINYLDRQSLPIAITELRKSIEVSDTHYGLINSMFLLAYGTMYAVGGRILDVLGTKVGYTLMIVWWSVANMLHGVVSSVTGLGIVRFLLGVGEGGGFPGSAKAISEWFPLKERAFAFGIFNTGSSVGAVIAPPLITAIITVSNWRWGFVICGLFGLFWIICWWKLYSKPAENKYVSQEEKAYIASSVGDGQGEKTKPIAWRRLFHHREEWGLIVIKFLTDAAWYFFIFWLPKYLNDVRGLDLKGIGAYAWIPYACAGAGSFLGGWGSSYLLKRGFSLDTARKIPLGIAAALLPFSLLIASASLNMAIVFFSLAMFGHQAWSTIVQTLAADIFPSRVVGSVAGLMGCIGTYGAMLFSFIVGMIIEHLGYSPAFLISGVLHPLSFLLIFLIIKKINPVRFDTHLKQSKKTMYEVVHSDRR